VQLFGQGLGELPDPLGHISFFLRRGTHALHPFPAQGPTFSLYPYKQTKERVTPLFHHPTVYIIDYSTTIQENQGFFSVFSPPGGANRPPKAPDAAARVLPEVQPPRTPSYAFLPSQAALSRTPRLAWGATPADTKLCVLAQSSGLKPRPA